MFPVSKPPVRPFQVKAPSTMSYTLTLKHKVPNMSLFWIVLLLLSTRPEAAQAYNSPSGTLVILVGLALSVVAYRIMLGIGRLPEERRWFG